MSPGLKARLLGLVLLVGGIAFGWFFGLHPLEQARAGTPEIRFDVKVFIAAPMAIVAGIVLLIGGGRVLDSFTGPPKTKKDHMIVWPVFALAAIAGGVGYWWFDHQLAALGYHVGG